MKCFFAYVLFCATLSAGAVTRQQNLQQSAKCALQRVVVNASIDDMRAALDLSIARGIEPVLLNNILADLSIYERANQAAYFLRTLGMMPVFENGEVSLYVDPRLFYSLSLNADVLVTQNRIVYRTITAAMNFIRSSVFKASAIWRVYIAGGCYAENVTIPSHAHVSLIGLSQVILGSGREVSATPYSLTWELEQGSCAEVVVRNMWIRDNLVVNGAVASGSTITLVDVRVEGSYTQDDSAARFFCSLYNGYFDHAFNVSGASILHMENVTVTGISANTCYAYGYIQSCTINSGLTFTAVGQGQPYAAGFYDCNLAGVFTGSGTTKFRLNAASNYYFVNNHASLVNATKEIIT